jgi:hypothetical protein
VSGRVALLLIAAALAIGAWWMIGPRNSWRYKMTIEVETPQGVRSGYAVRQVTYRPAGFGFLAESKPHWRVNGQAVIIELPGGRTLYALLTGNNGDVNYGARIADRAMGGDGGRVRGWPAPVELYPSAPDRGVFKITDPVPMLVTFADPHDPKSIRRVDPANLAASFGPGVRLRSIRIAVTGASTSKGIQSLLPWLETQRGSLGYDGRLHPDRPELDVTPKAFVQRST